MTDRTDITSEGLPVDYRFTAFDGGRIALENVIARHRPLILPNHRPLRREWGLHTIAPRELSERSAIAFLRGVAWYEYTVDQVTG